MKPLTAWYRNRAKRGEAKKTLTLDPIMPSAALRRAYEKKMRELILPMIEELQASLKAIPRKSQDQRARTYQEWVQTQPFHLREKYVSRFRRRSVEMARWFTVRANKNVKDQWRNNAEKYGLPTVGVDFSQQLENNLAAILEENVNLIRSIPEQYFDKIQDAVLKSQQAGNDLELLTKDILKDGKVTKKRAEFIARDQNAKATSFIARRRELDLGIRQGVWMHSRAARHPRKSHVQADGKKFDLDKGMLLADDKTGVKSYQFPGQEINCGCTHRPVIVVGGEEIY